MTKPRTPQPQQDRDFTVVFDPMPIRRSMAMKNLTLREVACRIGCSIGAVWRITTAKTTRPKHLHDVCKLLGVKVEDCYPLSETTGSPAWSVVRRAFGDGR